MNVENMHGAKIKIMDAVKTVKVLYIQTLRHFMG
jgi:hypothetical protein